MSDKDADIVNLNKFRKKKERAAAVKRASENRVRHGRTKAEKEAARLESERCRRALEGLEKADED